MSPDIQAEIDKVKRADLIILNFPLYWTSVPAILKGWIDRVFVSGLFMVVSGFTTMVAWQVKAMLCLTLGGRTHMFGENSIHGPIEHYLSPIQRGTLAYTGFKVLPHSLPTMYLYLSQEARETILEDYVTYLTHLDQLEPLKFPKLEEFDEKLYPL